MSTTSQFSLQVFRFTGHPITHVCAFCLFRPIVNHIRVRCDPLDPFDSLRERIRSLTVALSDDEQSEEVSKRFDQCGGGLSNSKF